MFDNFADYMFYLLYTPLRKGQKLLNQFFIFFKTIGKLLDDTKADILRVREESMVLTASEPILAEHGADRELTRFRGESTEDYRYRLAMKAVVAEKAGTLEGILLALRALGYINAFIEPFYLRDRERWAEFLVWLVPNDEAMPPISLTNAFYEVRRVKEVGSKPTFGLQAAQAGAYVGVFVKYGCSITIGPKGDVKNA